MYVITKNELQQLLLDRSKAHQYALDHYDELAGRKHTYTLYGPHAHRLGASIPCNTVTPKQARKLLHKTRRKNYVIYHLDEHYRVIRTIIILDYTKVDIIYHHFEIDGVVYACGFSGTMQDGEIHPCPLREARISVLDDMVLFLKFQDGKPVSYGNLSIHMVFVQFYEYVDDTRMLVTSYRYWPHAERNIYGYPIDPEAPIGAINSAVHQRFYEEIPEDTDFSRWFK